MQNIRRGALGIRIFNCLGICRTLVSVFPRSCRVFSVILFVLFASCGQGGNRIQGRKGTVKTTFRFLEGTGQLKGYLNFFQLTQRDSLIPDPRLYHFEIEGQRVRSGQMDNSFFTYFLVDTIDSHEFQLNILPDKATVKLNLPRTPGIEVDSLFKDRPWQIRWNTEEYGLQGQPNKDKFLITVVISDENNSTVLKKAAVESGEILFTPEDLSALQSGVGYYYVISTLREKREAVKANFRNVLETYSRNQSVVIYAASGTEEGD